MREDIRLLIDAGNRYIPLQYRYLSLYKLIEIEFKHRGDWRKAELDRFLDPFASGFCKIGISKKPRAYLAELRGRCAHIKTGGKNERLGVTHLNHQEAAKVERILPILGEIAVAILNARGKGKVKIERKEWLAWRQDTYPTGQPAIDRCETE